MKTKEVKYYDSDCSLVREKLMARRIVEGKETIEEADYSFFGKKHRRIVFFGIARQATLCRSIENMEGESHR